MNTIIKETISALNRLKSTLNRVCVFLVLLFIQILLFSGCATVKQPMGGPKDETPPEVLSVVPKNLTTNFKAAEIVISFDEFVKLNNEFTEISTSPDMEIPPLFKIKKKSLIVTLPDSLEKNTTYAINFGNAIVDFNEGNELKNFSYVFSTGPIIDSLTISGKVKDALTLESEEDITVLLLPIKQDSMLTKKKASIFSRTDSSGNFSIKNLHEGVYKIYALKEKNNDRIYNNPDELIAFHNDSLSLQKDITGINLTLFKEIPKDFRVLNRFLDNQGKISILLNKPIEEISFKIINNEELDSQKITKLTHSKDTAYMWLPEYSFDSLEVELKDSSTILDTIKIKRNKKDEYDRKITLTDNLNSRLVNKITNIILTGSVPLKEYDKSKIILTEDSIRKDNFQIEFDSTDISKAVLKYNWKAKKNYELSLEENAFIGNFNEKSTESTRKFTYDETENYGDIILKIIAPDSSQHYLVQLMNDKDEILKNNAIIGSSTLSYKNLLGIKYKVRIVYDDNANGKWDTGDLENKIQPEHVWFWNKIISIRPNWEQEDTITIPTHPENKNKEEKKETKIQIEEKNEKIEVGTEQEEIN